MPARRTILAVLLGSALPRPALAQNSPVLRVASGVTDTYAEGTYAVQEGFFKDAGLNVALTTSGNGTVTLTAILAHTLDIGISNTIVIATAVTKGFPLVMIAGGALYLSQVATSALCVARDASFQNARDLEGQVVGVSALRDLNALGAKAWLSENGADLDKVRFVELGFAAMGPALERGTVAAATMGEPFISQSKGKIRIFSKFFDAVGKQFMNGVWFTTPDFVRQNPVQVHRFAEAIYTTARWANAHHAETAVILSKSTRVDLETVRDMARTVYAENLDERLVQPSLDLAYKFKVLDRPVSAADLILSSRT